MLPENRRTDIGSRICFYWHGNRLKLVIIVTLKVKADLNNLRARMLFAVSFVPRPNRCVEATVPRVFPARIHDIPETVPESAWGRGWLAEYIRLESFYEPNQHFSRATYPLCSGTAMRSDTNKRRHYILYNLLDIYYWLLRIYLHYTN
jgi:hypothetical protein